MTEEKSILEKAKELATDIKDKVSDLVGENEEKITGAIDRTGEFVDDKTKHKYTEKIDKAQEAAKNAVSKVAASSPSATTPDAGAPASTTDAPTPTADAPTDTATKSTAAPDTPDEPAKSTAAIEESTADDTPEGGPTDPTPDA